MSPVAWRRAACLLVALACAAAALWLATRHPLSPALAVTLWTACLLAAWRWPLLWLCAVPAAVPLLSLAPWTGWIATDEFDLLFLAVAAAGHARLALHPSPVPADAQEAVRWRRIDALAAALWLSLLAGLVLAWVDVHRPPLHESGVYTSFANSLRVAKGLAYALLAMPLLRAAIVSAPQTMYRWLGAGVVAGLAGMCLAVLWEREATPGLLNFASDYRTTALFWEMHVGGAALDAYLAIAVPFGVWAMVAARRPLTWAAAAVLVQVLAYVCLTTFARGVYGAVLGGLVVTGLLLHWRPRIVGVQPVQPVPPVPPWRARANAVLRVVLVLEIAAMTLASSFLFDRLRDADNDFGSRMAHWSRGLTLVQTPRDWLAGIGLGRLPERYADLGRAGEFPGAAIVQTDAETPADPFLRLYGPPTRMQLAGRFSLSQQVELVPQARYRLDFDLRAKQGMRLRVRVCERHLLYEADCQVRHIVSLSNPAADWERMELELIGPSLTGGPAWAPRLVSLDVSASWPGASVDLDNFELTAGGRPVALANPGFDQGLARWYPAVDAYFLPWHIDNLYLEWLIERGVVGLLLFAVLMALALWRVSFGAARGHAAAPWLAASLASGCALGLVSSIMDMPRVAFLFLLLAWWALHLPRDRAQA